MKTEDIRIRDPFIYADPETGTYYMYAQAGNRAGSDFTGVEAYSSRDLENWESPRPVLVLPDDADIKAVWAPEVFVYQDTFYLFVTLTLNTKLDEAKPVAADDWPEMHMRGTHIFAADSPAGPFAPIRPTSFTPLNWMALDGTLHVEDGKPFMVFCHEWVQTVDGLMVYIPLKDDFSMIAGTPQPLFEASSAPGAYEEADQGKITDGPFMYTSRVSGKLFMIWSTFIRDKGYSILVTRSESGRLSGPWKEQKLLYTENGGHGMIFRSFEDKLLLALHQPNTSPDERLKLFELIDTGETLELKE